MPQPEEERACIPRRLGERREKPPQVGTVQPPEGHRDCALEAGATAALAPHRGSSDSGLPLEPKSDIAAAETVAAETAVAAVG